MQPNYSLYTNMTSFGKRSRNTILALRWCNEALAQTGFAMNYLVMPIWQNNIISNIFSMSYLLTPYQIEDILNSIINPINGHSTLLVCLMSQNWQGNGDKLNMVGILELPVYRKCFNIHASLHVHVRWATVTCWMRTHIQRPKRSRLPTYPNAWVESKPRSKYIAWNIITIIII